MEQISDDRQGSLKGIAQFLKVWHPHIGKGRLHLGGGDAVVTDEKIDILHVLMIRTSHHLGENEIDAVRAEELQPTCSWTSYLHNVLIPIRAQENLIFLK